MRMESKRRGIRSSRPAPDHISASKEHHLLRDARLSRLAVGGGRRAQRVGVEGAPIGKVAPVGGGGKGGTRARHERRAGSEHHRDGTGRAHRAARTALGPLELEEFKFGTVGSMLHCQM